MKGLRFLRAAVAELVSLIVDDVLTFTGALVALVLTYLLAHRWGVGRSVDGFVLLAVVWVALAVSMRREASARRRK